MKFRFWYALAAIAIGVVGLYLDFSVIAGTMTQSTTNPVPRSLGNMLIYYWSFLTNLSNFGLILVYLGDVTRWRWLDWFRQPVSRAAIAGLMLLVMGFYHFMLSPTLPDLPLAIDVSNVLLHYVTPIAFLVWWGAFSPHGALRYRDIPAMLVPGLLYVAYIEVRGLMAGEYPYTILDPGFALPGQGAQGYPGVAIGVGILVVLVAIFDLLLVVIDGLIARRMKPA